MCSYFLQLGYSPKNSPKNCQAKGYEYIQKLVTCIVFIYYINNTHSLQKTWKTEKIVRKK